MVAVNNFCLFSSGEQIEEFEEDVEAEFELELELELEPEFSNFFLDLFLLRLTDCTAAVTNFSNSLIESIGYLNSSLNILAICLILSSCSDAFLSLNPNLSMSSNLREENCFHLFSSVKFKICLILCVVPLPVELFVDFEIL